MAEIRYDLYPNPNNVGGVQRYIEQGIPTGDFLSAVISNDLKEAVGRADDTNIRILPQIVSWFYNNAPYMSWGDPNKRLNWIAHRGLMGPKPSREIPAMWKCPVCGLRVRLLPPDLTESCPRCAGVTALDFITKAGNVPWLNDNCPGWADEDGNDELDHVPDDPACHCRSCTVRRAELAEWRLEGDR